VERLASKDLKKRDKENFSTIIQPILTKEIEDQLVESSRDKLLECIKTSTHIHEILEVNNIDKEVMLDILYQDKLFRYQLGILMFKMRTMIKKRIEEFLYARIERYMEERKLDKKLMSSLQNLQARINVRMQKLQSLAL
jgi:hypothetical protein